DLLLLGERPLIRPLEIERHAQFLGRLLGPALGVGPEAVVVVADEGVVLVAAAAAAGEGGEGESERHECPGKAMGHGEVSREFKAKSKARSSLVEEYRKEGVKQGRRRVYANEAGSRRFVPYHGIVRAF